MKNRTKYWKTIKVTWLFCTCAILFLALFFAPVFPAFESEGENWFEVSLNGQPVGSCGDVDLVDELIADARRKLVSEDGELVYIPAEVTAEGREVLFGQVDGRQKLEDAVFSIMQSSVQETLQHAYTIKINEYTVNLGSSQDVLSLLQAVLERYDTEGEYRVELVVDPDRELNVLTTSIVRREEGEKNLRAAGEGAGVEAFFDELFVEVEPDVAMQDFASLDYGLVGIEFGDVVEIVDAYLPESEITSLEDAVSQVTADQQKEQIYEVQAGDTLSQIAEDRGLSIDDLIAINPSLDDENSTIRTGDELIITVPEPELSVIHQERIYTEDSYDAEVEYIDNDSWYTTKSEVRQQPSAGFRKAASVVTYRNDTELSEEVVKEEVVYEAVPKVVERGTKVPPTFIKPISGGRLSSSYGRRNAPTKGASTNHQGVDWATPTGTAVMASCGGTVTRAGWASGYGYVVYIQHEGGRETRYGHLSRVLVSVGEKVEQGEKIALSGNTGRSTGPHLHFELRINGASVNPFQYLQ